jgi:hypothetical protein
MLRNVHAHTVTSIAVRCRVNTHSQDSCPHAASVMLTLFWRYVALSTRLHRAISQNLNQFYLLGWTTAFVVSVTAYIASGEVNVPTNECILNAAKQNCAMLDVSSENSCIICLARRFWMLSTHNAKSSRCVVVDGMRLRPLSDLHEYGDPVWNDVHGRKPKNPGGNLSQCHLVRHKSHMDWPGIEHGPSRWEASD